MNEAISILLLFDGLVRMTIVVDEVKMKEHIHPIKSKQEINQISKSNNFLGNFSGFNSETKKCYFSDCQIQYFIKQKKCLIQGPSLEYLGYRRHGHCQCYEYVPVFDTINR